MSTGEQLLTEQNHRIHFEITDGKPFRVEVKDGKSGVKTGDLKPAGLDVNDLIHFQLSSATLSRLFDGKIRFTDALIPIRQDGSDAMLLLECTLFKWSVLSWVGRISARSASENRENSYEHISKRVDPKETALARRAGISRQDFNSWVQSQGIRHRAANIDIYTHFFPPAYGKEIISARLAPIRTSPTSKC